MVTSVSPAVFNRTMGFSVWDQLSYSDHSLPFGDILSADHVRELFAGKASLFGYGEHDLWNTGLTLWAFIGQVLQDGKQSSCNAAVTHAGRYRLEHGLEPPSPDSGAYCRARHKLRAEVLRQLVREIATKLSASTPEPWLWLGKRVKLVDGFTFTMPDTPENQAEFPQAKMQAPGLGFPIARACAVLSLAHAGIMDVALGPYAGKETGETALLRQVLDGFETGEVLLADRYFCSFFMLAILKSRGIEVCMRLHQLRKVDPGRVRWLGPHDYIDTWYRPQRTSWMSPELYASLPEQMAIRVVRLDITTDQQTEPLQVVTTLLDHRVYPAEEIGILYGYRWHAELDLGAIKQTLHLDHLRGKTPAMIRREFWMRLLAYNLVRWVGAQAAAVHDKLARQMSFTLACNALLSQWLMPPEPATRKALGQYHLIHIARNEVGNRPGRIEPRVVKRRPKSYSLMIKPRHQYPQGQR